MGLHRNPIMTSAPRNPPRPQDQGLQTYATLLQRAGGEQVQAVARLSDERAVCAALYTAPPYDLRVPAMGAARLAVNLTRASVTGGVAGERPRHYDARRYSLFLAPAGAQMHWRKQVPSRHLTLYFRPDALAGGEEAGSAIGRAQEALQNLAVPGLRPLVDELAGELRGGGPDHHDAADCLARLLLIRVSRHLRRARRDPRALSAALLARLKEHVMAHLGERILVADLAREAGLSVDQFTWSCRAETGRTPHQWVLALRMAQACHLLQATRLPIAEVAQACGFSSQQHLTNALRSRAGITPARLRQAHAGPARPR